jgi:hypothetical protein
MKAYQAAVNRINASPSDFKEILITRTQFPPDVKDKYAIPVFPAGDLPAESDVTAVQEWLMKNDLIKMRIPYTDMIMTGR